MYVVVIRVILESFEYYYTYSLGTLNLIKLPERASLCVKDEGQKAAKMDQWLKSLVVLIEDLDSVTMVILKHT